MPSREPNAPAPTPSGDPPTDLDRGLVQGLAWSGLAKWGGQLITWLSTLVVARLLSPDDYGLMGMALVFAGLLDLLTDMGIGSAVVQARRLERRDLEATMGATCLLGLLGGAIVLAGAPLWAEAYGEPRLVPIVAMLSGAVVLTGVVAVPNSLLQRRLAFGLQARAQLIQGVATALFTLGLALSLGSYWALVLGYVSGKAVFTLAVLLYAPVRPRQPWGNPNVRPLLRYGLVLAGDRLLYYLRANFDLAFIGLRLGDQALGLYIMAVTLARLPLDKLGAVITPIAFPIFSRAQDDPEAVRRHYQGLVVGMLTLLLPAISGLMLTADLLVPALIGPQWQASVLPLKMIVLFTPAVFLWSLNHSLLNAMGRVQLNLWMTMAMTVIIPPAMLIGARWGTAGVAAAGGLAYLPVAAYGLWVSWRMIDLALAPFLRALVPSVSATAGMTLVLLLLRTSMPPAWPDLARTALLIVVGIVVYPAWAMLWHRRATLWQLRALRSAWRGVPPPAPPHAPDPEIPAAAPATGAVTT